MKLQLFSLILGTSQSNGMSSWLRNKEKLTKQNKIAINSSLLFVLLRGVLVRVNISVCGIEHLFPILLLLLRSISLECDFAPFPYPGFLFRGLPSP